MPTLCNRLWRRVVSRTLGVSGPYSGIAYGYVGYSTD